MVSIYWLALGFGLAGGFAHCIGMCGIFVVSVGGLAEKGERRRFAPGRHLLFHAGRLISLTTLGALAGAIVGLGNVWAKTQGIVSIGAGVVMLGLALGLAGIVPRWKLPEPDVLAAGGGRGRRLFVRVLQSKSAFRPFLVGLFVGLLPCGLTYTALLTAATATLSHSPTPQTGALLMLLFGLGTVPGLLTLGVAGSALFGGLLLRPAFRQRMTQVAAVVMAVMAAAFVWRGWANF